MDDERIAALARLVIELQAVTEAQGELIARLFALVARTRSDPSDVVAQERLDEERVAYAAAVLPGDEASDRLLAVMARKADAKRAVFELANTPRPAQENKHVTPHCDHRDGASWRKCDSDYLASQRDYSCLDANQALDLRAQMSPRDQTAN